MKQLSEVLESERLKRKLNKSQFAGLLGISSQLYGQYESGDKKPGGSFFVKWKEVVGSDLAETMVSKKEIEKDEPRTSLEVALVNLTADKIKTTELMQSMEADRQRNTQIIEQLIAMLGKQMDPQKAARDNTDENLGYKKTSSKAG